MGAVTLDASFAIALFSADDAHHRRAVSELGTVVDRGDDLSMAASAYSEILVHALREDRGDFIDAFVARAAVEIIPADREIARRAARLRAGSRGLRLPDALVAATAQLRGAELLSFDRDLRALVQS